jgi:hypothetical protein
MVSSDTRLHVVVPRARGRRAFCGSGRILVVTGDFAAKDPLACPTCSAALPQR